MQIRRITIVIAVLLVACIAIAGTIVYTNQISSRKKLFSLEDDFWKAYIGLSETKFDSEGKAFDGLQENGEDYINYFIKASEAVELIYKANKYEDKGRIAEARSIIERLMATYNKYGKFPRPAYQELEEGWVSSMDAPVVALASELMYEYTGEKKYREYALELLPYTTKKLSGGGIQHRIG